MGNSIGVGILELLELSKLEELEEMEASNFLVPLLSDFFKNKNFLSLKIVDYNKNWKFIIIMN